MPNHVVVAEDPETLKPFILDLSSVARTYGENGNPYWDDEWRFMRYLELLGATRLYSLRKNARRIVRSLGWPLEVPQGYDWVYASRNRPVSFMWASALQGKAVLVNGDYEKTDVWTWIVSQEPLETDITYRYELTFAWSPWYTPAKFKHWHYHLPVSMETVHST